MEPTFKSLEHEGWNERAASYDQFTAQFTSYGIAPLISATCVGAGLSVLDVCTGTGLAAQMAVAKGARVTGIDISEAMIAIAKARGLDCAFQVGDAEHLPFGAATFDCVICNFGLYHLPEPDRAINEAARVLRANGRYAFTTWCGPEQSPLFRILPETIKSHGRLDVGLPPAPPPFRLASPMEARRSMTAAGFHSIAIQDVPAIFQCRQAEVIDFLAKSTVRMTMVLQAQEPASRDAIHNAIRGQLAAYAVGEDVRIPMPAILVTGVKD